MSYKLKKLHTKCNYEKGNSGRQYIVIHYTGNTTDTAKANANYFYNVNRGASAHFFVDDTNVYEVVSPNNTSWAVGVNYGNNNLFGKCTNYNSINIEMCSTKGKISDKTFANTVALARKLMNTYSIPASRVVRHYDVCSKQCPGWSGWVGNDKTIWKKFKNALGKEYVTMKKDYYLRRKAYIDPVAKSNEPIVKLAKGAKVEWLADDKTGFSKVKYNDHIGYTLNTMLDKKGLSKYRTKVFPKGSKYHRIYKGAIKYSKTMDKARKFTIISYTEEGRFKGWYYVRRNGRYYFMKP
ncbi:MAG: peptidoglycan recognition family protein [Acutalibacteraceae bacterium]|nr:peptidoglycan recognition family protein [Acutalibacteraceae bacterium]